MPEQNIKIELLPHQLKAHNSSKAIAGICGGRALGKSFYLSLEAMWALIAGKKVMIFGDNYKTLKLTLFKEVLNRFKSVGLVPKVNIGEMSIKYGDGELYGFTYQHIDAARGLTEVHLLLLDELALAPPELLPTVAPCLRGTGTKSLIRFATTPRASSYWNKWFKDPTVDKDLFTGTMFDNYKLTQDDFDLAKNSIKDEKLYRQEVLGEIFEDDVDFAVISFRDFPTIKQNSYGSRYMGIDCAGSGADYTVFIVADNTGILDKVKIEKADTFQLHTIGKQLVDKWGVRKIRIDVTGGFGNGIQDMLKMSCPLADVIGVNFGQKAIEEHFANARAEMYFNLVDKIRNGFYIDDEEIKEELTNTTYVINGSGKTILTPKKDIKELIQRSPDSADALALALYDKEIGLSPAESRAVAFGYL